MVIDTVMALPRAPEPSGQEEIDPCRQEKSCAGPDEEPVMSRVLLIEDDHGTAREIMAELVDRGFEVDWAATGIEGLDKARTGEADVMIVDRLLPVPLPALLGTV
jgi:PleD family two-component response regulator